MGSATALQGRSAEGRALAGGGAPRKISAPGAHRMSALRVAWLSEVWRLVRTRRGRTSAARAARRSTWPGSTRSARNEALALHQLGAVQAHADPPDAAQAEAHYRQALALAEELGMSPAPGACHGPRHAVCHDRKGGAGPCRLLMAIEMYQTMEMTFWLPQAEAALAQVEGR